MSNDNGSPFQTRLSLDETLAVVSSRARRELIRLFIESSGECIDISDVVSHLNNTLPETESRSIETELYHVHFPKLVDAGLVDIDRRSEVIRYHPDERLEKWMDIIDAEYDDTL